MNELTGPVYVVRLEEILWGGALLATTMAIHGLGMLMVLRMAGHLNRRFAPNPSLAKGLITLTLASWMIMVTHLLEVCPWAEFFRAVGAVEMAPGSTSVAYYVALSDYTTLGCEFTLVPHWRLLHGMIAVAGLMTFAWSTGVLLTLAQAFQDQQLQRLRERRARRKSSVD